MNNAKYLLSSGLLMTFCLCLAAWETTDELNVSNDAGYNRCDYAFFCLQRRRCVMPIDEECRLEILSKARESKRMFAEDKRTGRVKIKNIALNSYLNRLG